MELVRALAEQLADAVPAYGDVRLSHTANVRAFCIVHTSPKSSASPHGMEARAVHILGIVGSLDLSP